jgi:hypothetical protein
MYCTVSTVSLSHIAQGLRRTRVEPVVAEDVDERHKSCPKKEIFIKKNSGLLINRASIVLRSNLLWRKPMCDGSQGVRVGHGPWVLVMLCWCGVVMSYLLFPLTLPLCVLYIDLRL